MLDQSLLPTYDASGLAGVLPADRASVRMVALSTTLATNALVEGHGSPVCLLLIGYGRDALPRSGLGQALGADPVAYDLHFHAVEDRSLPDHPDWKLFGLMPTDVIGLLGREAARGHLQVQNAGQLLRIEWNYPDMEHVIDALAH